jgi:hypothetical protein
LCPWRRLRERDVLKVMAGSAGLTGPVVLAATSGAGATLGARERKR